MSNAARPGRYHELAGRVRVVDAMDPARRNITWALRWLREPEPEYGPAFSA